MSDAIRNPRINPIGARRAALPSPIFSETKRMMAVLTPMEDITLQNERMLTSRKNIPASLGLSKRATAISTAIAVARPSTRMTVVESPSIASRRPTEPSDGPKMGAKRSLMCLTSPRVAGTAFDDASRPSA